MPNSVSTRPGQIVYTFPVEFEEFFDRPNEDEDRYDGSFGYSYWAEWVAENPNWDLVEVSSSFTTSTHDMPGYEGDSLVCCHFWFRAESLGASSRSRAVRREYRTSVPAPTKLPLP